MPPIPTHNTAVVDEAWDASAEVAKLPADISKAIGQGEWAWYDGASPDTDNDGGYPDAKDAYKFPHHKVADGKPGAAVKSALDNALARLDQADIPEADKAGVRQHIQHHLDAFNKQASAARAEAIAASAEQEHEREPEAERAPAPAPEATGVVSAGFSDLDLARGDHAAFERLLGKPWAITREAAIEIATRLAAHGYADATEQRVAQLEAARQAPPRRAAADGSELAVIPLRGTITPRGSLFSLIFGGGGGLQMFREQFRQAVADGNVSAIVLDIDSPGGLIDLVPEATSEILSARGSKPIIAVANTTCASAAYWLASAADTIVATPSAQVGSIGVFTIHEDFSKMDERIGIKTTLISAGDFKTDGNPYEPLSKTARAALQQEVDDLYGMFTGQVAEGRGVSPKAVQAGYGRGRCVLADQALTLGMIDRVETLEQTVARIGGQAQDPQPTPADLIDDADVDDLDDVAAADKASPHAGENPAAQATGDQDVSTPSADYLSEHSGTPEWALTK